MAKLLKQTLIHIMLWEGYGVFNADHPAVAVELKLAEPVAYPLNRVLSVAYKHNQVCLFHP